MTKELYTDLYLLITNDLDTWKSRKESAVRTLINFSDCQEDIGFQDGMKELLKTEKKIIELNKLLTDFEAQVEEPD